MIFLVCESSTLLGSVAVFQDDRLLASRNSLRQGSHTNVINRYVHEVLAEASIKLSAIDLFVSGIGPGSFTGIRISLNLIKTFAYCHNKPVLGINSLENLANQVADDSLPIISMINAYKNMVYIATYSKSSSGLKELKPPEVVRVQQLANYITTNSVVTGDGYIAYAEYLSNHLNSKTKSFIHRPAQLLDEPVASATADLVIQKAAFATHWSNFLPLYLRASEAEEVQQGIKYQPLT